MWGLLLKDFYMMKKYCKAYLFIVIVFMGVSFFDGENMFFAFYPCMLCSMIPITLLAYDERSKWLQYSETLPYTRAQIVNGKYIIGLGIQIAILFISGISQALQMRIGGIFQIGEYFRILALLFTMSSWATSITFPFIFKFGVEKGRIAYYVIIAILCGGSIFLPYFLTDKVLMDINLNAVLSILFFIGLGAYVLSWYLSIVFYRKREL